jgi:hypothetical protein
LFVSFLPHFSSTFSPLLRQVNAATSIEPCGMCTIPPTLLDTATGQVGDKEVFTFRHDASGKFEGGREEGRKGYIYTCVYIFISWG